MQTAKKLKPEVAPKKQLKVIKTKNRLSMPDSSSMFSLFLLFAFALAAILIFNVSQRALIAQGALQNEQLKNTFEKEQLKHQELLVSKTELGAPDRIEKIAIEELEMVNPGEISYLELPNNVGKHYGSTKPLDVSKPKKDSPWQIMTEHIPGFISMSPLRDLNFN